MINALIATLIFAISPLTLLQFFASYCHSLIAESREHELSEQAREISGVNVRRLVRGDQFKRLLQLIALCPGTRWRRLSTPCRVSTYFGMLGFVRTLLSWAFPAAVQWIETERGGCAYVAAVVAGPANRLQPNADHGRQFP